MFLEKIQARFKFRVKFLTIAEEVLDINTKAMEPVLLTSAKSQLWIRHTGDILYSIDQISQGVILFIYQVRGRYQSD